MRNKIKYLPSLAGALLGTYGISYLLNIRENIKFSFSFLTLLLVLALFALSEKTRENLSLLTDRAVRKRRLGFAAFLSVFFGVLMTAGYQLQWFGYTEPGFTGKFKLLLIGGCIACAVFPFANGLLVIVEKAAEESEETRRENGRTEPEKSAPKKSKLETPQPGKLLKAFLAAWLGIWLCWIPVWLAYYPAIMSYDFHKQSLEALLGPAYFNSHHPLAHTFLIWVFRGLGERLGSYETGFAYFSLFQQLIVSAVLGYACVMVYRLTKRRWAAVLTGAFFGLFPLVSVFVMCTTKDVLFGAFFVLFLLLFIERSGFVENRAFPRDLSPEETAKSGKSRIVFDILWMLSGILMMLFRNNALYAMVIFAITYVICSPRKEKMRALVLSILLLAGGKGALAGIQAGFHAYSGSDIEKYSVVYQSMARVGQRQKGNLSPEAYALLDHYVAQECWEDYNPPLADSIKSVVQEKNMKERKSWSDMGQVLAAWLRIGIQYPNEYLDAFLDLTRGYWFLDDTSHAEMLGVGLQERMGLLYTYNSAAEESLPGMQHISRFPWLEDRLEELLSNNCYYCYPVVANLFKPALWCWLLVVGFVCSIYVRKREAVLLSLYPLCYFGTMLLGPTAIVRYTFPIMLIVPLLAAMLFAPPKSGNLRDSD